MEHQSNDLPWGAITNLVDVNLSQDGRLDESDFDQILELYSERVDLVVISYVSNLHGLINPIYLLAEKPNCIKSGRAITLGNTSKTRVEENSRLKIWSGISKDTIQKTAIVIVIHFRVCHFEVFVYE